MGKGTSEVPSSGLCDLVANLTEEGLELERRLHAWATEACERVRNLDAEAASSHLDAAELDRARLRSGLGVVHALAERMLDSLGRLACPTWDEETAA
jgi:hypothetical protein